MAQEWGRWSLEVQENIQTGMYIQIKGKLGKYDGEMEIELLEQPVFE
jgi:DNA/RNA endonuclease YhcR with UshA esterase domain